MESNNLRQKVQIKFKKTNEINEIYDDTYLGLNEGDYISYFKEGIPYACEIIAVDNISNEDIDMNEIRENGYYTNFFFSSYIKGKGVNWPKVEKFKELSDIPNAIWFHYKNISNYDIKMTSQINIQCKSRKFSVDEIIEYRKSLGIILVEDNNCSEVIFDEFIPETDSAGELLRNTAYCITYIDKKFMEDGKNRKKYYDILFTNKLYTPMHKDIVRIFTSKRIDKLQGFIELMELYNLKSIGKKTKRYYIDENNVKYTFSSFNYYLKLMAPYYDTHRAELLALLTEIQKDFVNTNLIRSSGVNNSVNEIIEEINLEDLENDLNTPAILIVEEDEITDSDSILHQDPRVSEVIVLWKEIEAFSGDIEELADKVNTCMQIIQPMRYEIISAIDNDIIVDKEYWKYSNFINIVVTYSPGEIELIYSNLKNIYDSKILPHIKKCSDLAQYFY